MFFNKKKKGWLEGFDQTDSLFIHIPKTAGTSIAMALYQEDPWHYPIQHYQSINTRRFEQLFKFAFCRNPFERVVSSYLYSFKQARRHPTTSVKFVTEYSTFREFVITWLNPSNIRQHYFFQTQASYILLANNRIGIDFLGRFETLEQDFKFIQAKLGLSVDLPKLNSSESVNYTSLYDAETQQIVYDTYREDFELFGYADGFN